MDCTTCGKYVRRDMDDCPVCRIEKKCPSCSVTKPMAEFDRSSCRADGRQSVCKACGLRYRRATQIHSDIKRRFGISKVEFEALSDQQGGKCAICLGEEPYFTRLSVDHDHETGAIRGLLCGLCNKGLGLFKDDPQKLRNAIEYLASARPNDSDERLEMGLVD